MSSQDIIRAWKNPEYLASLSDEQRAQIPDNPVGAIELSASELDAVAGGRMNETANGCACTWDFECPFSDDGSGCAGTDLCNG